ncbi:DUF805 domain-containing protein [Acetobacteraceae bacterium]|nr:DUF805 domain-containing protein [Acetobacteraceae bacterium]
MDQRERLSGFDYFLMAFKKYVQFSGRSTRSEYWYFVLFYFLIAVGLKILLFVTALAAEAFEGKMAFSALMVVLSVISIIFALGTVLPAVAIICRRLHDVNYSGWWQIFPNLFATLMWFSLFLIYNPWTDTYSHIYLGSFLLLSFSIPFLVSFVWILVLLCTASDLETNRFGEVPCAVMVLVQENLKTDIIQERAKKAMPPSSETLELIVKLSELRDKGILTDEEFQQKKSELL